MSSFLYYLMIGGVVLIVLMLLFKPIRAFVFSIFGAKNVWAIIWSGISVILIAHWTVLRNFMPRSFIYPSLDDRKTTNAEE